MVLKMISDFIESSKRIFTVSRKPDRKEFMTIAKVTAIGTVIIALIGYLVMFIIFYLNIFK